MRDQGGISWCYAHASADYLQFYNRIPVQISAADIAVNFNLRRWPRFWRWVTRKVVPETGFARTAIWDISKLGYCPEEYFPSETWTKRIMTGKDEGKTFQIPIGKAVEEIVAMVEQIKNGIYMVPADLPFVYEFKGMSRQQYFDAIFKETSASILDELRSAACDQHRKPFPKGISDIGMGIRGQNAFRQINRELDQHSPLTVDFFYGFLENIDDYQYSISQLHTTLLMGRRFDSKRNECQYLIKNSYGTDCSSYDRRHQCDEGYVWVSESSLQQAMTSYVYIKN